MKTEMNVGDLMPKLPSDEKQDALNIGSREKAYNISPSTAVCTGCKRNKSLDEFHKNRGKPNGHQAHCKACTSAKKKRSYKRKQRQQKVGDGFSVQVCGNIATCDLTGFVDTFAESVRELVDHEKL